MSLLFFFICLIGIIVCVCFTTYCYKDYKKILIEYEGFRKIVHRKYIKTDVILQNAVLEAYEQAIKKGNHFEEKAYERLLNNIKGKW